MLTQRMLQARKEQQLIVAKLTDLEILGIPERQEGSKAFEFLEKCIKSELHLLHSDLKMQHCNRSLRPKPPPQVSSRYMITCFLLYKTKVNDLQTGTGPPIGLR